MLKWKGLLLSEEFENERLPKIVPAAFGKMESKNRLDLPTRKPTRANAKKRRKLPIYQDATHAREVNRDVTSFCCLRKVRKPVQCSCLT